MNTNTPQEAKVIDLQINTKTQVRPLETLFLELFEIQKRIEIHLNNNSY